MLMLFLKEYVRTDIPCLCEDCLHHCNNAGHQTLLSSAADHYIIPDVSVTLNCLFIL